MTIREKRYRKKYLNEVRHITMDPKGPGVVRIHMIPPKEDDTETTFLLLINGAQLVPLTLSWAILLSNFMEELQIYEGKEIEETQWQKIAEKAVNKTHRVYPGVRKVQILSDLDMMMSSLIAIARGEEPDIPVSMLSLGDYAAYMTAPHRMDLMVSAMTKNGQWHCNQKCLHCYAAGQVMGEMEELSTQEWQEILTKLRRANIPQVTFTGGEPTMRDDLVELVRSAQWFVTRLNTNGILLTQELCKDLYEASLDSVQVTLYDSDAQIHNTLVNANGFEKTIQGIKNAVDAGLIVSVNTPLCSLNKNYAQTLRFAHKLGVRYATCSGLIPSGGAKSEESKATALSAEELTGILEEAMDTTKELGMELDFTSPGWLPETTLRELGYQLIPSCGACLSNMAIAPDGTVVPCQSWLGGVKLGNILQDSWETIWNHEKCKQIRDESTKMEHICQLHRGNTEVGGAC